MNTVDRCAGMLTCAMAVVALTAMPARAENKFFNSNGVQIRYIEQGRGEPVVLVHDFGGSVESAWVDTGVVQNLSKDHRVIAFDVRGFGKSGKPHDPKMYGREMAFDVVRLLDHLGIDRAHMVGYSLGTHIVAQLAVLQPERFLTMTLGGGGAGRYRWTARDVEIAETEAREVEQTGVSRNLEYRIAPTDEPPPTEAYMARISKAALADEDRDRFAEAAVSRSRPDQVFTPEQAAAVTVPTLGICGSADPVLSALKDLKTIRPSVEVVIVEGATHIGTRDLRRRPEFVTAIRTFIARHPAK